jgi:hypothetical protein
MSVGMYRNAMNRLLNRKIFQLAVMIRIVLPDDCYSAAGTGYVYPSQAGVKLNYIATSGIWV